MLIWHALVCVTNSTDVLSGPDVFFGTTLCSVRAILFRDIRMKIFNNEIS